MDSVIVWSNENGAVSVCYPTGELPVDQVLEKDCPAEAIIVNANSLPQNQGIFFEAWELVDNSVRVNLNKAKTIAHNIRRARRAEEFAPLDKIIAAQIPGNDFAQAEAQRQIIRDKYSLIQQQIDDAQTPDEIIQAIGGE